MKKLKHEPKKLSSYCAKRFLIATNREASLFWLNRHYEVTDKEQYELVRGGK